mmetsp:Transcript_25129/g.71627  ORF Transcript_25129/g.71627 Transcript_25129/m.71627 type:complete len:307 (+) Transcript_25129:192-1112(+)
MAGRQRRRVRQRRVFVAGEPGSRRALPRGGPGGAGEAAPGGVARPVHGAGRPGRGPGDAPAPVGAEALGGPRRAPGPRGGRVAGRRRRPEVRGGGGPGLSLWLGPRPGGWRRVPGRHGPADHGGGQGPSQPGQARDQRLERAKGPRGRAGHPRRARAPLPGRRAARPRRPGAGAGPAGAAGLPLAARGPQARQRRRPPTEEERRRRRLSAAHRPGPSVRPRVRVSTAEPAAGGCEERPLRGRLDGPQVRALLRPVVRLARRCPQAAPRHLRGDQPLRRGPPAGTDPAPRAEASRAGLRQARHPAPG